MTVCNEGPGPDADAFVGLAQVAWGMGEHEDAVVFAREAATLDPQPIPPRPRLAERMETAAGLSSSVDAADDGRYESVRAGSRAHGRRQEPP